jgi:hypothetical protein
LQLVVGTMKNLDGLQPWEAAGDGGRAFLWTGHRFLLAEHLGGIPSGARAAEKVGPVGAGD